MIYKVNIWSHFHFSIENGIQLQYKPEDNWCDFPENVQCGDRPICDANNENCVDVCTRNFFELFVHSNENILNNFSHPEKLAMKWYSSALIPAKSLMRARVSLVSANAQVKLNVTLSTHEQFPTIKSYVLGYQAAGEICCQPGLYYNPAILACDWSFNIPGCNPWTIQSFFWWIIKNDLKYYRIMHLLVLYLIHAK